MRTRAPFLALVLLFGLWGATHAVEAGDLWTGLASGRHFRAHGVSTDDPFSTRSLPVGPTDAEIAALPGLVTDLLGGAEGVRRWHPTGWINQNWLAHELFYWLSHESPVADAAERSYDSLVWFKLALCALCALVVHATGRALGAAPAFAAAAACAALAVARTFLDIRPAGFSNLCAAVLTLVLVLAARRDARAVWLTVPLAALWANLHGGFILVFVALAAYAAGAGADALRGRGPGVRGAAHAVAAGAAALVASVLLSPFRLTNVTHPVEISVGADAVRWRDVKEWHGAFDFDNPVGSSLPFVLFLGAFAASAAAAVLAARRDRDARTDARGPGLAVVAVAVVALLLAVKSRRFVPIGAFVAAPVLAALLQRAAEAVRVPAPRAAALRAWAAAAAGLATLVLGAVWGARFARVYLGPHPLTVEPASVFMRMTQSYLKPFGACAFLRANGLAGELFCYWTDGTFVAYGQEPDPATGETPAQVFMDNRAQTAYDADAFDRWEEIMTGGPFARDARAAGRPLGPAELTRAGNWIDEALAGHHVWLVLMPASKFASPSKPPFMPALLTNPNWRVVYYDGGQMLLARAADPRGRALVERVRTGAATFPDEASRGLTLAGYLVQPADLDQARRGLALACDAFRARPTPGALAVVLRARSPGLEPLWDTVDALCREWVDAFERDRARLAEADGLAVKGSSAALAARHLAGVTADPAERARLDRFQAELEAELDRLYAEAVW